ncbi:MAG: glycosyltransferase family 4 protein [Actinobacteria bacterium]|nr:glycosyltransferase family 4 protein [Actinomycetota bacterium]
MGMSPLPFENDRKVYGTGIRTWQLLQPLLENGHEILVCNYAIPSAYEENFITQIKSDFKISYKQDSSRYRFDYNILSKEDFENTDVLRKLFLNFKPHCVVGCTFYPSFMASVFLNEIRSDIDVVETLSEVPFWADLFGHVMAEAQARAFVDNDDSCLFHYWNSEYNIITTADVFSCVSERQQHALIGELGAVGRLNRHTAGYNFSFNIPCGMPDYEFKHDKNTVRGFSGISDDDFILLWTGGYNTWTDIDTLFASLEKAMEKNQKIKFVSTGGEIPEQDLKTYPRFLSIIDKSKFKNNFIMKGWIKGEDVPNYYFEADAGINIDKDIFEVKYGSKNRILDWMRAGLSVLSSNVCELTDILEKKKVGYTFKPQNPDDLTEKILYLTSHRDEVKQMGLRGKEFGMKYFNFNVTTVPLQKWVEAPEFAPDFKKEKKMFCNREEALKNLQAIVSQQKRMIDERDKRIEELEGIVKKGFFYKIYNCLRIAKRKIFKNI